MRQRALVSCPPRSTPVSIDTMHRRRQANALDPLRQTSILTSSPLEVLGSKSREPTTALRLSLTGTRELPNEEEFCNHEFAAESNVTSVRSRREPRGF